MTVTSMASMLNVSLSTRSGKATSVSNCPYQLARLIHDQKLDFSNTDKLADDAFERNEMGAVRELFEILDRVATP